jgi:glycosyltransferase involved in cell wall biosynthesis
MERVAILPAYNLEDSIQDIVARTKKYVDTTIVVTDGSKDNTHKMAEEAGAICPPHTATRGKGFAVRKGIDFSKQFYPKYIILMDTDGQHLPEEIPGLIRSIQQNNADMVVGSRMKGELRTSSINKFGNFCLKLISFFVTRRWFTDTESGFRVINADKLYSLKLESTYYEIESELLIRALQNGFKVIEEPITVPKMVPGVTVFDGLKMGLYKINLGIKYTLSRG